MYDNIKLSKSRMRADRDMVAEFCANEVATAADRFCDISADNPLGRKMNALELHRAAVAMMLDLVERMEENETGQFQDCVYVAEEDAPDLLAHALLRYGETRRSRRQQLARHLSQHVMRSRVAPKLYGAETVLCHEMDGPSVREDIADRVRRMLVGED